MSGPESAPLLEEALNALNKFDRPDLAWSAVSGVLDRDPNDVMALAVASLIARRLGRLDLALAMVERALAISPGEPALVRAHAEALAEAQRSDEAVAELEKAAEAAPEDAAMRLQLAGVYMTMGRTADAEAAFRRAAELRPDDPASRKALVLFDMAAGRYEDAEACYRELLRIDGQEATEHLVLAGPFASVKEWCEASGTRYEVVAPAARAVVHPPRFLGDQAPDPIPVERPELYVAEMPDATVIGGEALIVSSSGELVWDVAILPNAARFDLAEGVVRYAEDGRGLIDARAASEPPLDRAIHLTGISSSNYYHCLVDVAARLANLGHAGPDWDSAPLLVDSRAIAVPQLADALRKAAGTNHAFIPLEPARARSVGRLLVLSPLTWMSNDVREGLDSEPTDTFVSAEAVDFLRHRLPPGMTIPDRGTRRICIVRGQTKRLLNGADLARVAGEFGFETVAPEALSLEDQIRLFADAEAILAETGAGLTNIVFAPAHAEVIVLVGDRWRWSIFSQIAGLLGQSMTLVPGRIVDPSRIVYQSGFEIDADELRKALTSIVGEVGDAAWAGRG